MGNALSAKLKQAFSSNIPFRDTPAAISISSFMHSFAVLDSTAIPKLRCTRGWTAPMDCRDSQRIGSEFHHRTGCPTIHVPGVQAGVQAMKTASANRIVSPKTLLVESLTGEVEDFGMAAARASERSFRKLDTLFCVPRT
jgi:hypothetical protein